MKIILILVSMLFGTIIISCDNTPKIHLKVTSISGVGSTQIQKDSSFVLNEDYIDIELKSYSLGKILKAEKDLEEQYNVENFKLVTLRLVNESGDQIEFKTSSEFLNYMSSHGYEMKNEVKSKYSIDYTFKKKLK